MRPPRTLLLFCVFWIPLLWAPAPAANQYAPTGLLEVVPQSDAPQESIRLDSGEVTIRLGQRTHVVDAVYEFYNTGETTTQRIGFPIPVYDDQRRDRTRPTTRKLNVGRLDGSLELPAPSDPNVGFREMEVRVNDRNAAFSEERDFLKHGSVYSKGQDSPHRTQEPRWMVSTVTFPGHAKTAVWCRFTSWSRADRKMLLSYGTGRGWKGKIAKLVFVIDCADVGGTKNVEVTTDCPEVPGKGLRSENLILMEERDIDPTVAAHLSVDVDPYRTATYEAAETHKSDYAPGTYSFVGPRESAYVPPIYYDWRFPEGQPAQMWSEVDYDPKLNDPFFRSNEGSNARLRFRHKDPLEDSPRLKRTAKCFSSSFGVKHVIKFCEAKLLQEHAIALLIHESNPGFRDALRVRIRNGKFACQYWIDDDVGAFRWTTTRQELTLDKKAYRKGDVIKGRIDFECVMQLIGPQNIDRCRRDPPTAINVFGAFKTIVK